MIYWILNCIGRCILDISVILIALLIIPGLPPHVSYSYYELDDNLPFEGALAKNTRLNDAGRILDGKINGPESVASRRKGEIFTSLHNGKILRVWGSGFDHFQSITRIGPECDGPWQESKCGRPLGLRFAPDGRLIVVDAYLGIFAVNVDTGKKERLVDASVEIDGLAPKIPDDLDIDEDGNIYWSDASTVGDLSDGIVEMFSDPSGRLIKYDSETQKNSVLLKNIHFANGVQLSPDRDFVLVCETFRSRVLRHWLNGPNAGQTDVFVDRLPGKPDNLRARKEGGYYVSLVAVDNKEKVDTIKILAKIPLLRKLILRMLAIPKFVFDCISKIFPNRYTENFSYKIFHLQPIAEVIASKVAVVVELDADGNIVGSLQGDNGEVRFISETEQVGNYLFFGSPYNNYLGYLYVGSEDEEDEEEQLDEEVLEEDSILDVDGKGVRIKEVKEDQEKIESKEETKSESQSSTPPKEDSEEPQKEDSKEPQKKAIKKEDIKDPQRETIKEKDLKEPQRETIKEEDIKESQKEHITKDSLEETDSKKTPPKVEL